MTTHLNAKTIKIVSLTAILLIWSCGIEGRLELPSNLCEESISANSKYKEVRSLIERNVVEVTEDLILEGYVISSDVAGNFFNTIYVQEGFEDHSLGFQIELELGDAHLFYPEGSHIYLKLKGLYLGKSGEAYKIGFAYNSFGSLNIGRIPSLIVDQHIVVSCAEIQALQPKKLSLDALTDDHLHTYVEFDQLEFNEEEMGTSYAAPMEESERILTDCRNNEIELITSGYSDFQSEILPEGNGKIRGVLLKDRNDFQIRVSRVSDIEFDNERCRDRSMTDTSDQLFISEIADPENDNKARFVELYNGGDEPVHLDGWELRRYTNENTEVSSSLNLNGLIIRARETLVISSDAERFQEIYGFASDLEGGTNSAADSNGDDNLELADPLNNIIDRFGIPGEDGTGTDHEFEDGGAFRKPDVLQGSPEFVPEQWIIYNDSGEAGTILQPLLAPEDYSPGVH